MKKSLLTLFGELDYATKNILADVNSPRILAFLTLHFAKNRFGTNCLSTEHMVAYLEAAGVAQTKNSIVKALAGAKGCVSRRIGDNDEVFYTLMTKGEREAEKVINSDKLIAVLRFESGQPRQARIKLAELLKPMTGTVRVCDPFYGLKTLNSLELFPRNCKVRFLSQKTSENISTINAALVDFYRERPGTELRIATSTALIHDRYIITKDQMVILGHGIKDIGNKESFVIVLDKQLVPDLINEVIASYDHEWVQGSKVV